MTRDEQRTFIRELMESVEIRLLNALEAGKIPETWDGYELRELLYEHFDDARMRAMVEGKRSSRYRNYRNHVLVNNL